MGLPSWLSGKESTYQCRSPRRWVFDSGWGRSPGGGNGNPIQYSCLGNLMDRGAWRGVDVRLDALHQTGLCALQEQFDRQKALYGLIEAAELSRIRRAV